MAGVFAGLDDFADNSVGGVKGSTKLWSEYFAKNPGRQQAAFDVVIRVSETIDAKYGTSITEDLLENIVMQRFDQIL